MSRVLLTATWHFGRLAVERAFNLLEQGAPALDALEAGINAVELDESVQSVGYGGLPNRAGFVELDAAIMDARGHRSGAVAALRGFRRPISVARRVMEVLPHALLVGDGAADFAREQGFEQEETLSPSASEQWLQWRETQAPPADVEDNHDTVGMIIWTPDTIVVGCSTSGLKWKYPGRVGDSPIVGAGLYADEAVGAAVATGDGDEISRVALCARVVFLMEQGSSAQDACDEAIRYLMRKRSDEKGTPPHAAVLAVRADGDFGVAASYAKFPYALHDGHSLTMGERDAIVST
ncbi:MAG: N(4)-(beta-N-acetylglucosaminyl)-L-asparaginase [Armatimonadota bacterium]|nr:N(4)-(beta-N-acetylglucosaminyl)-L-asparaginase [bacterium]MDW8321711.1 N(4)-(beta-N-acetylglucosaminyl)-L-asparaginase [Armatimonadota bacterium]